MELITVRNQNDIFSEDIVTPKKFSFDHFMLAIE